MSATPQGVVEDMLESLVVLTHDPELLETLRAVATDHHVSTVGVEADLAGHLLDDHAGVAVLDTASVSTPISQLTQRLKAQFPDLVLIVAGDGADQAELAAQITNGTVYRFLHKPVSEQRVRLFINAAWRRHGVEHAEVLEATATNLRKPTWAVTPESKRNLQLVGGALGGLFAALLVIWLLTRGESGEELVQIAAPGASELPVSAASKDAELESLLARADAALNSGALTTPPGENAVDLYRQAARRNPSDPRPGIGIERVMDRLLTGAEQALLEDRLDDAVRITDTARAIQPDHVRVAFLTAQIGKERERLLLTRARQAAASGRIDEAIAVLDRADLGGATSPLAETRRQIEQQELSDRVRDFIARANERMQRGALIEPAQDNARFFIESARAIAPNDASVRQAQRQLSERIVSQARAAIAANNPDEAERWIGVAGESGVSRDEITALNRDVARVRIAVRAESMARLSQAFNQRLTQGQLVEPANDSAKFFLVQLTQADANHPSTQLARQALVARLFDEARSAVRRQDLAGARRWIAEAREVGADQSGTALIEQEILATQESARRANEVVTAAALTRTRYVQPEYPVAARERRTAGWVEVEFTVRTDGSVGDVTVVNAEPAGVFENAALASVRRWRYEPVVRDGQRVEQRARVRIRFSMDD
jgi:TonB family protein